MRRIIPFGVICNNQFYKMGVFTSYEKRCNISTTNHHCGFPYFN